MKLAELITRLGHAGFDLDAEQLLDAFWLASLGRDLSLGTPADPPSGAPLPEVGTDAPGTHSAPRIRAQPQRGSDAASAAAAPAVPSGTLRAPSTSVFARGDVPLSEPHLKATQVVLPAPRMLDDRLGLMRALRPLMQRWPSASAVEIDEEGTVEAIARMGAHQSIVPVFRARGERWFEVELVLEDDASVELWADMLREFAGVLRNGGMFRAVRLWRLRTKNLPSHDAYIENAGGGRIPAMAFLGKATRRLIIFASNGASARWSDGRYTNVLEFWTRDNAVLLLQLSPPSRWARTRLGEPHGLASTTVPGASATALRVNGDWWRMPQPEAGETLMPLPVADLTPSSLGQWAAMQMARGRTQPAYLLRRSRHVQGAAFPVPGAQKSPALSIERMIASLQYESPNSVRLATLLSTAPFTVSVARLVQAIEFKGDTDPAMLAELMRSGIVVDVTRLPGSDATVAATYFRVRPEAAEHLLRAMRRSEAAELGREIQRRVSAHLAVLAGSTTRSLELIADEAGRRRLPAWAQPFAHVAMSLLGLPETAQKMEAQFQRCINSLAPNAVRALADMAAKNRLVPDRLAPALWTRLSGYGLIYKSVVGSWTFAPGVRDLFGALRPVPGQGAVEARAVLVALDVLNSMALTFHVGRLPGITGGLHGISRALPHWKNERTATLAHWASMAEYVFAGPVTRVLATGEDPIENGDIEADLETLRALLDDCDKAVADTSDDGRHGGALTRLRLAVRLLSRRRPALFEDVLIPFIEDEVRRFMDEDPALGDDERWREDALGTIGWVRNDDVMQAVAPYMSQFFQNFDEWTDLALGADYPAYVERLFDTWRNATRDILASLDPSTLLEIPFPVDADSVEWVRANLPAIGMHSAGSDAFMHWTVPATGYRRLIDELAAIVLPAMRRRIARGRWRPRVLWVDDRPENNEVERELLLEEYNVEYTTVKSTEEALLLCRHALYDVVISNVGRPGDPRAGYTLIDRLRSQQNTVPFVIYSINQLSQRQSEALWHGAIGSTDNMKRLARLVLEALLRYDDALARRISPDLLLAYTERRFPGQETLPATNWLICRDVDESEFATLQDIDRAVDVVGGALAALMQEPDMLLRTGSDCLAVALCLASKRFRRIHALPKAAEAGVARYAGQPAGVLPESRDHEANDDGKEDKGDELVAQRLARRLGELVVNGQASTLEAQLENALADAVDAGDWLVDAESAYSVESEDEYGRLDSWRLVESGSAMFVPNAHALGTLSVSVRIALVVDVHSGFYFSVTDSIDKDEVSMGHTEASRRVSMTVDVDIRVTGIEDGDPYADAIDVEPIVMQVDFGYVQPDEWDADDE
ncbi:SAV_2336 N-terminal domain-related protein [Chromobacterium violaceum]|uniref:SAV_2336 N-terminal domain-related protein n=1 Tax=Chromobacterium violaceum TaxID=536 RepID=UPI003DA9B9BB